MKKCLYIIFVLLMLSACSSDDLLIIESYSLKSNEYNAVANNMIVDLYENASISSTRITQLLYNQPLLIMGTKEDFYKVTAEGNVEGYVQKNKVTRNLESLKTNKQDQKILITGKVKTAYSNTDGKIPIEKLLAGTELSYRGKSGDWVKVMMCEGREGYITLNNIILYSSDIPKTNTTSFLRDLKSYENSKYMLGGRSSVEGFDILNLLNICAKINGYELPPYIDELIKTGENVSIDEMEPGDIIFLSKDRYNEDMDMVAVVMEEDKIITHFEKDLEITISRMIDADVRNRIKKIVRVIGSEEK